MTNPPSQAHSVSFSVRGPKESSGLIEEVTGWNVGASGGAVYPELWIDH